MTFNDANGNQNNETTMADDEATSSTVTIQLNTDYQSAVRFPAWIALTTFSAICVAALDTGDKSTGWCMAVCVISMCLAFFATVAYLTARHLFVGTTVEAAWVFLILAFWGAGLPVIMNPSKHIATRGTEVLNANLYFFSWGAFATCLFLLSSILQELFGIDVRETSSKAARYYGLCAASLVVMGSSIRLYTDNEVCDFSDVNQISYCRRSKLGIAIGTISFILTAAVSYAMHIKLQQLTNLYETIGTTLLLILWCFGVGTYRSRALGRI